MGVFKSNIDICNDAIFRIGGKPVNSIENPQTYTETLMASMYEKNRRIVLRSAVWNFATKYLSVAKTDETVTGFTAVYNLPNDFIRFLGVDDLYISPADTSRYKLSDGKLYLRYDDPDTILLYYIRDVAEVSKYDALFTEAFSLRLAYNLSLALSGNNTLAERLAFEYKDVLTDAKMIDGQEQKPIVRSTSRWLAKRNGGSSGTSVLPYLYFGD